MKHYVVAAWLSYCKHTKRVPLNFHKIYINLWRFNLASFHNTILSSSTKILSNLHLSQLKFSYFFSNFFVLTLLPNNWCIPLIDLIMIIFYMDQQTSIIQYSSMKIWRKYCWNYQKIFQFMAHWRRMKFHVINFGWITF